MLCGPLRLLLPTVRLAVATVSILLLAAVDGHSQDTYVPRFPTTEFAPGASTASVAVGDLTATVSMVPSTEEPSEKVAQLSVAVAGREVLDIAGGPIFFDFPATEASIVEIDPGNDHPEVYFTSYSGGAHCCATVIVASEAEAGWTGVLVGEFDGGGDYLDDVDGDGTAEIVTVDNRFLYQFDCYACSAAPLVIRTVRGGEVIDISRDPAYRLAHREWLEQLESSVEPSERWTSPGFLAGWVAAKAQLGELDEAWQQLVEHWDWAGDSGEEVCLSGLELDRCQRFDRATLKFPERLQRFLTENGYMG